MIQRFPREHAFLERTRLRYVNLGNILSDAKRDRASRVPAYVAIFLGDETDLIFLLGGEPATAARLSGRGRGIVPIAAVLERAAADDERGDVAYHGAPEAQLAGMVATVVAPPILADTELDVRHPGRLFKMLQEQSFGGVLEVREGDAVHYVIFNGGVPAQAFVADAPLDTPVAEALERLFRPARLAALAAAGYTAVGEVPVQAPQALVELYRRVMSAARSALAEALGADAGLVCCREALERARAAHPALEAYGVAEDGTVRGHPVAGPDALTEGVAAWLFEALSAAGRSESVEPVSLVERITHGDRYALAAQGFFRRLPWPLSP